MKIQWTKEFINGSLKDLFIDAELSFTTYEEALDFINHLNKGPIDTIEGTQYISHQARIVGVTT